MRVLIGLLFLTCYGCATTFQSPSNSFFSGLDQDAKAELTQVVDPSQYYYTDKDKGLIVENAPIIELNQDKQLTYLGKLE